MRSPDRDLVITPWAAVGFDRGGPGHAPDDPIAIGARFASRYAKCSAAAIGATLGLATVATGHAASVPKSVATCLLGHPPAVATRLLGRVESTITDAAASVVTQEAGTGLTTELAIGDGLLQ